MPASRYDFPRTRLWYGPEALARLPEELEAAGILRPLVLCGRRTAGGPAFTLLRRYLPDTTTTFQAVEPNPTPQAIAAAGAATAACGPDGLVALGGGSAIDSAKLVALSLGEGSPLAELRARLETPDRLVEQPLTGRYLPIVAVPTTASASELTPGASVRDPAERVKWFFWGERLVPVAALLDPELARTTPLDILCASGVNALSHAVEALYSRRRSPFGDAPAYQAIRLIGRALPRLKAGDLEALSDYQVGAALSGAALAHARTALGHAICHSLGAVAGVSHGDSHAIMLPHAIRFNADVAPEPLAEVHRLLRPAAASSARGTADAVAALIRDLGLPARLRDVGVPHDLLAAVAANVLGNRGVYFNPRPVTGPDDVLEVPEPAW